jgi:hypothetical protein
MLSPSPKGLFLIHLDDRQENPYPSGMKAFLPNLRKDNFLPICGKIWQNILVPDSTFFLFLFFVLFFCHVGVGKVNQ